VTLYLDTSVLIALFVNDPHERQAEALVQGGEGLLVSDLAAAEFSSAISGFHRMGRLPVDAARDAFVNFDAWVAGACLRGDIASSDVRAAERFMRRLDLTLRTPDALHIAAAQRLGAELATFDIRMANDAKHLGVPVVGSP
jgi:predicted nucleic acid-binding protein